MEALLADVPTLWQLLDLAEAAHIHFLPASTAQQLTLLRRYLLAPVTNGTLSTDARSAEALLRRCFRPKAIQAQGVTLFPASLAVKEAAFNSGAFANRTRIHG